MSLTAQIRVQPQHNLCRICATYIVIGTQSYFSQIILFPLPVSLHRDPYLRICYERYMVYVRRFKHLC
jgi:hypothetical protein